MKLSDWRDILINNKSDTRLMIPRACPRIGYTLNFGQPLAWVFIIVLILGIVISILISGVNPH